MTQSGTPPRIFLVGNTSKPSVAETLEKLAAWLKTRGMLAGTDLDRNSDALTDARPDYVIALGGDGTILSVGQAMHHRQVPIIGVNMGKLGYLADFDAAEIQASLDEILENPKLTSRRMMFDVRINGCNDRSVEGIALNDCVIRVGDPFRTVRLAISTNGQRLCTFAGDGVILATPTGSTAHNMSCGGPILEPGIEAIIVTPKSPHSFTHRPVVVSPEATVDVHIISESHGAAVVLDGQRVHHVGPDAHILVSKSKAVFQLVRNPARTSWDTLITKLKWGQDVT